MQAESGLNIYFLLSQIMKSEVLRVTHELQAMKDKIKENSEKIKVNKTLPYLVSNVIEVCVCGGESVGLGDILGWGP